MAVVRITADRRWFLETAAGVEDRYVRLAVKRMTRELRAAADRSGRTAELTASEVRTLALTMPTDGLVADALERLVASEERDRARRVRTLEIMDRRREQLR